MASNYVKWASTSLWPVSVCSICPLSLSFNEGLPLSPLYEWGPCSLQVEGSHTKCSDSQHCLYLDSALEGYSILLRVHPPMLRTRRLTPF